MIQVNKRSIGVCILLSIITFGIYGIYWMYLLVKNTHLIQKDAKGCTGEMLCLIFVPFYYFYWWYTRGEKVKQTFAELGLSSRGNGIAYLLLEIFGLNIISMAIMQNDFNSSKLEAISCEHSATAKQKPRVIQPQPHISTRTRPEIRMNPLSSVSCHPPHRKNTSNSPAVRMDPPESVVIPMALHIGKPAIPTVKVGDTVKVGTKIGVADGNISSNIYSGVSGTVAKIEEYRQPSGEMTTAVVINSDGEMSADPSVCPPTVDSRDSLIAAIRESGIVGLGGAGFPTHVKLDVDPERIEHLIINGAECEPYVTSDTVTMLTRKDDMAYGLRMLNRHLGISDVIIGIENNKKEAISAMRDMAASITECKVSVKSLPPVYPQGGEKVLIHQTTGRKVPAGKLPIDVGCIVINCTTLAAIGAYLRTGMPLVEKCITVDGGAVKKPQNVIAPIGTLIEDLFEFCGGLNEQPAKIIYGGPMMGVTVPDASYPVLKNTNAVLALTEKEAKLPASTACIRCGSCTNNCPFGIAPAAIALAYEKKDTDELKALSVVTCMECGCCSYVCPANRPLVQTNKLAKQLLKEEQLKEVNKQ